VARSGGVHERAAGLRSLRVLRAVAAGARFQAIVETEWDSVHTLHDATFHDGFYEGARCVVEEFGVVAHPGVYRLVWESGEG
jgi:hypothetical protein